MKRTNIMLDDDQHKKLKSYAEKQGRTLGGLVRDALQQVYRKKDKLEQRREVALHAYQERFISLGKLAEILGLDPAATRDYLQDQGIPLQTGDNKDLTQDTSDILNIDPELRKRVEAIAQEERRSLNNQLRVILEEWIRIKKELHPQFLKDIEESIKSGEPEPVWKG